MVESEKFYDISDPKKHVRLSIPRLDGVLTPNVRQRLYFAAGYGLIQCVKALMSYEDEVSMLFYVPHAMSEPLLLQVAAHRLRGGIIHVKENDDMAAV